MQRQAVAKACAVVAGLVVGGGLAVARPASAPPPPTATLEERPAVVASHGLPEVTPQAEEPEPTLDRGPEYAGATPEERVTLERGFPEWTEGLSLPALHVEYRAEVEQHIQGLLKDAGRRRRVEEALKVSGRYAHLVLQILREHALPEDLMYVAFASSGFQPSAVSSRGDAGLWQLSPTEAVLHGLTVKPNYDERRDVELATRAVARRLADLHQKYGTWELALAAHHAGDATVSRVADVGETTFWELAASALPRTTREFVPLVIATAVVLKNQQAFQFGHVRLDDPVYPTRLQVPAGTDLSLLARAAGTSADQIRALNPAILSEFVPSITRDLSVYVPSGSAGRARLLMAQVMSGYGADAMHRRVPSSFDWGRDELPRIAAPDPSPVVGGDPWLLPSLVAPPAVAAPAPAPAAPAARAPEVPAAPPPAPRRAPKKQSDWADLASSAPEPGGR